MARNPAEEWLRLAEHYRSMSEGELLKLARGFAGLTTTAQQVLRDEMKLRGWSDPQAPRAPGTGRGDGSASREQDSMLDRAAIALGGRAPKPAPDAPDLEHHAAGPVEYTWKTLLCLCDSSQEAWQMAEALRRAGIDSWIEGPQTYASTSGSEHTAGFELGNQRVLVAADQLDEAREVAARPIPLEIVEQSKAPAPEFEPPVCPRCGTADPILEGVDPVNAWKCEACGAEWSDPEPESGKEQETGRR